MRMARWPTSASWTTVCRLRSICRCLETHIVEVANPMHPFGVRGVGEVPIAPPLGAIPNAINDAIGVRLQEQPMKPGRILEALATKNAVKAPVRY